jgi:hypothetical protein
LACAAFFVERRVHLDATRPLLLNLHHSATVTILVSQQT